MSIQLKSALAAGFIAASALGAAASAQEVEANVALVTDYRFRGVSLSDETIALQGGFDLGFENGFYVGTWGSTIDELDGSELELDAYAGFGYEFPSGISTDVGVIGYFYPGGEDLAYGEIYGSVGTTLGIVDVALGAAYAPEQDNIGDDDNIYVFTTAEAPLGDSPFTVSASLGWEDGAFGDDKIDWSIGIGAPFAGLDWSLAYIDTSEDFDGADATGVLTVSKAF